MKTTNIVAMALLGMFTTFTASAQNNVGIGTTSPDASAALEIESTTQGLLPPRMTQAQRDLMPVSPATTIAAGLLIWCTNCGAHGELQVYNGTAWTNMVGGAASSIPIITVQQRLDGVVVPAESPKQIYDSGMPLDSLYGKIYKEGLIAYLNTSTGSGFVAAPADISGLRAWGCYGTLIAGAHGTAIGTGY